MLKIKLAMLLWFIIWTYICFDSLFIGNTVILDYAGLNDKGEL